jgi:hypothetical protein
MLKGTPLTYHSEERGTFGKHSEECNNCTEAATMLNKEQNV